MFKKLCGLTLLLISAGAFAEFCPCPSSFNLIHIGDSLSRVTQVCCKPSAPPKIYKAEIPVPEKWTYNITPPANPGGATQGSVELLVTFDSTKKVTNITVNAQSLTTTNCGKTPAVSFDVSQPNAIKIGDTQETVKATCGDPLFKQKGEPQGDSQSTPIMTELNYAGPPPVMLIFENGILKEIKKQ